jgi:hypothetical protein
VQAILYVVGNRERLKMLLQFVGILALEGVVQVGTLGIVDTLSILQRARSVVYQRLNW